MTATKETAKELDGIQKVAANIIGPRVNEALNSAHDTFSLVYAGKYDMLFTATTLSVLSVIIFELSEGCGEHLGRNNPTAKMTDELTEMLCKVVRVSIKEAVAREAKKSPQG